MSLQTILLVLGIRRQTISRFRKKLAKSMKKIIKEEKLKVGGEDMTVEVDGSKFGYRKLQPGKAVLRRLGAWHI